MIIWLINSSSFFFNSSIFLLFSSEISCFSWLVFAFCCICLWTSSDFCLRTCISWDNWWCFSHTELSSFALSNFFLSSLMIFIIFFSCSNETTSVSSLKLSFSSCFLISEGSSFIPNFFWTSIFSWFNFLACSIFSLISLFNLSLSSFNVLTSEVILSLSNLIFFVWFIKLTISWLILFFSENSFSFWLFISLRLCLRVLISLFVAFTSSKFSFFSCGVSIPLHYSCFL